MKVRVFVLILMILFKLHVVGQISSTLPTIIPPSPNVAAFQKYGDIPVSAYTGIPNVSIPLYKIVSGDITVPISISYHTGGIKVSEESSRVGLGWVLNAGGMISRSVVGTDDFIASPNSYMDNTTHTQPDLVNGIGGDLGPSFSIQYGCHVSIPGFADISNYLTNAPTYDFQPDIFYYNFLNYSGKYNLKSSGAAVLDKQSKINIQFLDPTGSSWKITTDDGTVYMFTQYETYTDFTTPGTPSAIKSAWYLTSITSPTGNQVTFQYGTSTNYINTIGGYSETQNPSLTYHVPSNLCSMNSPSVSTTGTTGAPVKGKLYTNLYLDKIIFRTGEVRINYADDRQDVQNDRRITGIQIYNYSPTGVPNLLKTWQFYQSYFNGSGDQDYNLGVPVNYVSERMRLDSVKEMDPTNNSIPPYIFNYNNSADQPALLPAKTSFARDHWGYYNGKAGNYSLVPVFFPTQSSDAVVFAIGTMGENRNTDPMYSGMFSLNQITYPTGGNTQFQFESNDFDIVKSNVNDHSWYNRLPAARSVTQHIVYNGGVVDQPTTDPNDIAAKTLDLTSLYTDPTSPTSSISLTAFFRFNQTETTCALSQFYTSISFSLTNAVTGQVIDYGDPFTNLGATTPPMSTCASGVAGILFANNYTIPPGKYIWKLHMGSNVNVIADVSLTVTFMGIASALSPTDFGGGLRVKRIIENDNIGVNPTKIKRYSYGYTDGAGVQHSYGVRMARPEYAYIDRQYKELECDLSGAKTFFNANVLKVMYGSDSNVPLNGSASGSVVGYDSVSEYLGENGENGKSLYIYKNTPDITLDYSETNYWDYTYTMYRYPLRPPISSTIPFNDNGSLLEQIDYANINGTFFKLKDVINTYFYQTPQAQWQWYGLDIRPNGSYLITDPCTSIDVFVYPSIVSTWVVPSTTTENYYSLKNIGSVLTKTTSYGYTNPTHMQLTYKTETGSNGKSKTTQYLYPADFADNQCDATLLNMKNNLFMHSKLVMKKEWLTYPDNSQWVTDGIIQKYKTTNGIVVPAEIATLNIAASQSVSTFPAYTPSSGSYPSGFETKLLFDKYDNYGNVWQDYNANDIVHSYIWDYFNNYPIAEAINADSSSIAFTSFEGNGTGNWTYSTGSDVNSQVSVMVNAQNTVNIFTTQTPASSTQNDYPANSSIQGIETGVKFTSSVSGNITGIRFYKTSGNGGTHIGELYSAAGVRLAQATFIGETATGWQTVSFSTPVAITAGTSYVAAYFSSLGNYVTDNRYFVGHAVVNNPLTAAADGTNGGSGTDPGNGQGFYLYTASPAFPNQIYQGSNYWVDVIYSNGNTPIANAGNNQSIYLPASTFTLNGSGSMGTITSYLWAQLSGPNAANIATPTAVTTSVSGFIAGTYVFQLSINGGVSVSQLDIIVSTSGTPVNIFTTQTPTGGTLNDYPGGTSIQGIETGVKFSSSVPGLITGIRFYKTSGNGGTHIGELYSSSGVRLAQATFTGETATGWQTVNFSTPVVITANTTYVAACFSNLGNYVTDNHFFLGTSIVNNPLTAPADATNGGSGIDPGNAQGFYKYTATPAFPNYIYQSSNYWVDVTYVNGSGSLVIPNAGNNQTITLPTSSVTLDGSGSSGAISGYLWSKVSGPNNPTIVSPTSAVTNVTGLTQGSYVFQLSVKGGQTSSLAFTGSNSYNLTGNTISKSGLTSGNQYVVSYWSLGGANTVGGGTYNTSTGRSVNGWTYYEHVVTMTSSTLLITGNNYIDELRLYPVNAKMTSYTYLPLCGVGTMSDVNNRVNYYEYDGFQRLIRVRDQDGNIIKTYEYHYQNQIGF
jgi:hypothetical protein